MDWSVLHSSKVPCPHCGEPQGDLCDLELSDDYQTTETECGDCGKPFLVRLRVSWEYQSAPKVQP